MRQRIGVGFIFGVGAALALLPAAASAAPAKRQMTPKSCGKRSPARGTAARPSSSPTPDGVRSRSCAVFPGQSTRARPGQRLKGRRPPKSSALAGGRRSGSCAASPPAAAPRRGRMSRRRSSSPSRMLAAIPLAFSGARCHSAPTPSCSAPPRLPIWSASPLPCTAPKAATVPISECGARSRAAPRGRCRSPPPPRSTLGVATASTLRKTALWAGPISRACTDATAIGRTLSPRTIGVPAISIRGSAAGGRPISSPWRSSAIASGSIARRRSAMSRSG